MTIIAACTDGVETWIGSDRLLCRGTVRTLLPDDMGKWVVHEGLAIATSGATRFRSILLHAARDILADGEPFLIAKRIAEAYRSNGVVPKPAEEGCEEWGGGLILAARGRIWEIDGALGIVPQPQHEIVADGAGWMFAKGAVWAEQIKNPQHAVRWAVRAANACLPNSCEGEWFAKL